jgi:predicted Zn-dependent peptidase
MKTIEHNICPHPIHETVLDNGLTVFSVELDTYRVYTSYVVGAGSYCDGENFGLAHLLEHLVSSGPNRENVHPVLEKFLYKGADEYAETSGLTTTYSFWGPHKPWREMLRALFSEVNDIMINDKKLQAEKEVVLQEIRDSEVDSVGEVNICTHLYPHASYLSHWAVGTPQSLQKISVESLMDFYKKYYTTANSAIIFVGPVKHEEIVKHVTEYSNNLPKGEKVENFEVSPKMLDGIIHDPHTTDKLRFIFDDSLNARETVALTYAYRLLTNAYVGSLFERLRTKEKLIYGLSYDQSYIPLESLLEISASSDVFEKVIEYVFEEISKIQNGDFSDDRFNYLKTIEVLSIKTKLEDTLDGDWVGFISTRWQEKDFVDYRQIYSTITKEEVIEVAKKYLRRDKCAVLRILPKVNNKNSTIEKDVL